MKPFVEEYVKKITFLFLGFDGVSGLSYCHIQCTVRCINIGWTTHDITGGIGVTCTVTDPSSLHDTPQHLELTLRSPLLKHKAPGPGPGSMTNALVKHTPARTLLSSDAGPLELTNAFDSYCTANPCLIIALKILELFHTLTGSVFVCFFYRYYHYHHVKAQK